MLFRFSAAAKASIWCTAISALFLGAFFPVYGAEEYGLGYDVYVQGLKVPESESKTEDRVLNVVKGAVNRVIGILWLLLLIMVIRGGIQMLTANGDDGKYNAGMKIVQNGATWLLILGASRFIISLIFFVIELVANNNTPDAGTDSLS